MPWGHFWTIVAQCIIGGALAVIAIAVVIAIGDVMNKRQ
jgi:hypothetical protein